MKSTLSTGLTSKYRFSRLPMSRVAALIVSLVLALCTPLQQALHRSYTL
jgi:hypothetical protein